MEKKSVLLTMLNFAVYLFSFEDSGIKKAVLIFYPKVDDFTLTGTLKTALWICIAILLAVGLGQLHT